MSIISPTASKFPIPSACYSCGGKLHKHGQRRRHVRTRKKVWYQVQRLRCCLCRETRTLLLPNMLPRKHYSASEIEQVLRKQEDPSAPACECGAEESTLRRWRREFPEKLSSLAVCLESLTNAWETRLISPLQRVYNALNLLVRPPPDQSRLAWAYFFVGWFHPVRLG